MNDGFAVFGLPRKLGIDADDLRRRFYELSRQHHPDFHHSAAPEAQADVLDRSARINRAYRALRDPIGRVEHLVAVEEGHDGSEGPAGRPPAPRDLLEEMLEVQEALEEARSEGLGPETRARLGRELERLAARKAAEEAAILGRAAEWDAAVDGARERQPLLGWFKQRLAARAYLRTVIDDLASALAVDGETHGSHRRD
jgi:molecular chaperone HscB